jgi:succinoglycan biosynthesis protein ExoA
VTPPRPDISVLLVTRREPTARLRRTLDALAAQVGAGTLEVLVAAPPDEHPALRDLPAVGAIQTVTLVANPDGRRSAGLNRALHRARAATVVRVDARSVPPSNYVACCAARLATNPAIGVVGAIQRPAAHDPDPGARGIARALRNPWLLGGAPYRRARGGGPADTAYLGAFRRRELLAAGGYDEHLDANEDFDLCARYRAAGQEVWIEPGLEVEYEPRRTHRELWAQYRAFGEAKVRYWQATGQRPNRRQGLALGGAVAATVAGVLLSRRPRRLATALLVGFGALALLDHSVEPEERDVATRVAAIGAYATFLTGWCCGIARGLARRPGPCRLSG